MIIKDTQLDFRFPNDAAAIVSSWLAVYKRDYMIFQDSDCIYIGGGGYSFYSAKHKWKTKPPIDHATNILRSLLKAI
jgi:hypothetical protein